MRISNWQRPMAKIRRDKIWRWRCQWSVVTLAAIALVVYNAVANMWLLSPQPCSVRTTPPPSELPTCEPCVDTAAVMAVDDDPIARLDLRLGRWDSSRSYRMFDYATVGDMYAEASANHRVCLATQSSIERLHELLRVAAHWTGPISVAVFVAGDELRLLRAFATWLFRCQPEVYARLALHAATPVDRPGIQGNMPNWAKNCEAAPLPPGERRADTVAWRARHPYPQNHLRNLARRNCHTPYVFLVDVDIVPSRGMGEALDNFLATAPKCPLCAYVVPTYELDKRVAHFPANKSELLRLSRNKLAIPFHRKVFIYNQYASNFSRWESSGGNETLDTHISHNVTNFELLYEPFYVAPDTVPAHDERFLGYGFTRNTQWMPSHIGIMGNEEADKAAKKAVYDGIPYNCTPLYTEILKKVKQTCKNNWQEYFDERSRQKGIWYKTIVCELPSCPWFQNFKMCRKSIVKFLRLRSGHIPSNMFNYMMGKSNTNKCLQCNRIDDVYHRLMECVRNEPLRPRLLKSYNVGICNSILAAPSTNNAKNLLKLYT